MIPGKNFFTIYNLSLNVKTTRCPEINILLENIKEKALIDTGSEISCISEEFYLRHKEILATRPTLPISGKIIKKATGEKSTRLKTQVLLSTKISTLETKLIFIVVPKLVKNCILGYDSQNALNMLINTSKEEILLTINERYAQISYQETKLNSLEYTSLRIEETYENYCISAETYEKEIHDYDTSYDISLEEIDEKIRSCENLIDSQRETLKNLILKNKEIFQKRFIN